MQRIATIILTFFLYTQSFSQNRIGRNEALLIREAKLISDIYGDKIWNGISKTPFTIILITDSVEFLAYHPYPSNDFQKAYYDSTLETDIYTRKRSYPLQWLATFPAVNGVNCIVVGTPENTGRSYTNWMITLLHEHFHQYVNSQPGYYDAVNKLNVSGGDETGMWMLNYSFPYDSTVIINQYQKFTEALTEAVNKIGKKEFKKLLRIYLEEKQIFKKLLKPEDYRYFSFQVWQEGLAAYTEYKFLQILESYSPSPELLQLKDFTPLAAYKKTLTSNTLKNLVGFKLPNEKRDCFYAVGFAEGLLLDAVNKKWRSRYFLNKFSTDTYFTE
jgi:hypothetical protein